jgi:hypothetical protein
MQDTPSSYSRKKHSTHDMVRLDHVALQAMIRLKVQAWCCPKVRVNEPLGVKNASKKKDLPLDLKGPWRGLGVEPPPVVWTFWCKNKNLSSPFKKLSTQAKLWQELVGSKASFRHKIRAHSLMQDTASSYKRIKITTQALLRPDHDTLQASYRLKYWTHTLMQDTASSYYRIKVSTQALLKPDHVTLQASYRLEYWAHTLMQDTASSYSRKKHSTHDMVRLDNVALQASFKLEVQAWCCPQVRVNEPPRVENASKKKRPTAGP